MRDMVYLTDVDIRGGADDVDLDIALAFLTKPTEEPGVLQMQDRQITIARQRNVSLQYQCFVQVGSV